MGKNLSGHQMSFVDIKQRLHNQVNFWPQDRFPIPAFFTALEAIAQLIWGFLQTLVSTE